MRVGTVIYYSTVVVVQEVTPPLGSSLGFAGRLVSFGQSDDPLRGGVRWELIQKPRLLAVNNVALLALLRSVQFS
jgi:hypothetical protein